MGPSHLFDTISFCEQHARGRGLKEYELPWSFTIRKTIFAPWHDVSFDAVATSLICYQVCQQCFSEAHEALQVTPDLHDPLENKNQRVSIELAVGRTKIIQFAEGMVNICRQLNFLRRLFNLMLNCIISISMFVTTFRITEDANTKTYRPF